ncbi:MAG: hypothetical protein ABIQ49_14500 [Gemmatimonadales bacterium]
MSRQRFALLQRAAVFAALVLATGTVSALTGGRRRPAPRRPPLEIFQELMPVTTHARCVNCHGGVDPLSGRAHGGGAIDPKKYSCNDGGCHSDAADEPRAGHWHQPPTAFLFVGKSDKELCAQYADFVMHAGNAQFVDHLEHDPLIEFAFIGLMAGARDPSTGDPPADPPRMSKDSFVTVAKEWLAEGHAACEVEGTITRHESVHTDTTRQLAPNITDRLLQTATRDVTVKLVNGKWQAQMEVHGRIVNESQADYRTGGGACRVTSTITETYDQDPVTGPAIVVIKDTLFEFTTPPEKDYRIDVTLPPEKTRQRVVTQIVGSCPNPPPSPPVDQQAFDWPEWTFTLEGHVKDPAAKRMVGGCDKLVNSADINNPALAHNVFLCQRRVSDQEPWLLNHGAAGSNIDASGLLFRMTTTWNVAFK